MSVPFTPPMFKLSAFNCPHCNAYAKQAWVQLGYYDRGPQDIVGLFGAFCGHCENWSIWYGETMVFPGDSSAPLPIADMPEAAKRDFREARAILGMSPRGAAALLRLALQKLCIHLGGKGKNLNEDIASLVKAGLPTKIQQALDTVRVIGNNAVHPGQIDITDDSKTAAALFGLVNLIADVMISQPKCVQELFDQLPPSQKEAIKDRDATSK